MFENKKQFSSINSFSRRQFVLNSCHSPFLNVRSWKSLLQFTFDIFMNKMMNFRSETDLYFVEAQTPNE